MCSCGSYVYNNLARFNSGVQFFYLISSCTNSQPLCKVVQLVYNICKVVSTLQKLMEGCLKFATTLLQDCYSLGISIKGILLYYLYSAFHVVGMEFNVAEYSPTSHICTYVRT